METMTVARVQETSVFMMRRRIGSMLICNTTLCLFPCCQDLSNLKLYPSHSQSSPDCVALYHSEKLDPLDHMK